MTLEQFLTLIQDEEARIELEIYDGVSDEYKYENFWLSDYRVNLYKDSQYKNYIVENFSFFPNEAQSDIVIFIKKNLCEKDSRYIVFSKKN